MRKISSFFLFTTLLFLLTGCFSDPVADEIVKYVNDDLAEVEELETEALDSYARVSGVNYVDDPTMYDALLNEVIPNYEDMVDELKSLDFESEELEAVNDIFIEAAELNLDGFNTLVRGLELQEIALVEEFNAMTAEASDLINEYHDELDDLAEDHGVTIEE